MIVPPCPPRAVFNAGYVRQQSGAYSLLNSPMLLLFPPLSATGKSVLALVMRNVNRSLFLCRCYPLSSLACQRTQTFPNSDQSLSRIRFWGTLKDPPSLPFLHPNLHDANRESIPESLRL